MDSGLSHLKRELDKDPGNFCLRRLVSLREARLGIKGEPIFLCHLAVFGYKNLVEAWEFKKDQEGYSPYIGPITEICEMDRWLYPARKWLSESPIAVEVWGRRTT